MSKKPSYEEMEKRIQELEKAESERNKADETLRESEEQYKLMFDNAPISYQSLDKNGCILKVNKAWLDSLGYLRDEVIGKWFGEFLHHDQKEIFQKLFPVNIQSHEPIYGVEFTLKRKDGSYIIVEYTARTDRDAEGRFVRTHCVFQDVTECKLAEDALRKSQKMLARTESIAHIGSWEWEIATDMVKWSEELFRIFQLDPDDGAPTWAKHPKLFHPRDFANLRQAVEIALVDGTPYELELRAFRADGETRLCLAKGFAEMGSNGKPVHLFGTLHDITERKSAEEALKASEENYRTLFHEMISGFTYNEIICDAQGRPIDSRYIAVNPAFERITGKKTNDVVGKRLFEVFPGLESDWIEVFGRVALTGRQEHFEKAAAALGIWFDVMAFCPAPNHYACTFVDITERKRAKEKQDKLQAQLSNAIEMAHLGHWEYDVAEDRFTFNDHFYKIFRTTAREVGGYTMPSAEYARRFVHPDDMHAVEEETQKAIETNDPHFNRQLEHRMLYADGTIGFISVRYFIVKDAQGKTVKTYGVTQDITQRKQAEDALRQSEATIRNKLKAIIEPEGDIGTLELSDIIDTEVLQSMMEDFYRITGMLGAVLDASGKVLVAVGWQDICTKFHRCHPDTLKNCTESDTILSSGVPPGTFKAYRCKNNLWDMVTPIMVGGRHVGNVFIGQFFYEDETPDVEIFREQARRYGFDEAEYLAALDRVPRFSREAVDAGMQFYAKLARIISTLSFSSIQQSRMLAEHKRAEVEKEKLEARLIQAQKMEAIGTLAGGIAHDFNNILSAVIGYAELAQMRVASDPEIKNDLKEVLTAGERAKDLVKQILAFSRQTQKEQMPVQTGLIIKEALKLLRSSLPTTIEIHQSIQSQSVILSDPTQLHQIVMNLCTNAAHAMQEKGGILEVTLTDVRLDSDFVSAHPEIQPGAYQKLTVSDSGYGITPEVMHRIFDPFFTTKPKDEGTGLGLSVVHGIVKDCGGTITVYSEPDKGTTFNLYFPITKDKAEEKPGEYTVIPTGTERILVVDDEKTIIDIIKKNLTFLGYAVKARTSSLEALELFKATPDKFDLVVTDMTMPQMTGDRLARELMKIRLDIPVILCTGFSENITREKAEIMGIKAFLMKPLLKEEMAQTIRRVLDEAKGSTHD